VERTGGLGCGAGLWVVLGPLWGSGGSNMCNPAGFMPDLRGLYSKPCHILLFCGFKGLIWGSRLVGRQALAGGFLRGFAVWVGCWREWSKLDAGVISGRLADLVAGSCGCGSRLDDLAFSRLQLCGWWLCLIS